MPPSKRKPKPTFKAAQAAAKKPRSIRATDMPPPPKSPTPPPTSPLSDEEILPAVPSLSIVWYTVQYTLFFEAEQLRQSTEIAATEGQGVLHFSSFSYINESRMLASEKVEKEGNNGTYTPIKSPSIHLI